MQIIIITAVLCLIGMSARSQTFAEWWHQKKTRLKYLREQVAALKSVEYVIRHGYNIEEGGLYDIRDIDEKERDLHQDYFEDLEIVRLIAKDCPEVQECLDIKYATGNLIKECLDECQHSPWLSPEELQDARNMFNKSVDELNSEAGNLARLVTDRQLKMTDGERQIGIRLIHDQIREKYRFVKFSVIFIKGLMADREKDFNDLNYIIHLN